MLQLTVFRFARISLLWGYFAVITVWIHRTFIIRQTLCFCFFGGFLHLFLLSLPSFLLPFCLSGHAISVPGHRKHRIWGKDFCQICVKLCILNEKQLVQIWREIAVLLYSTKQGDGANRAINLIFFFVVFSSSSLFRGTDFLQ